MKFMLKKLLILSAILFLVGAGCVQNNPPQDVVALVSGQPMYASFDNVPQLTSDGNLSSNPQGLPPDPTPFNTGPQPPSELTSNIFMAKRLSSGMFGIFEEKQHFAFNPGAATTDVKKETVRPIVTNYLRSDRLTTLTAPDGKTIVFTVKSNSVFSGYYSNDIFSTNVALYSIFSYDLNNLKLVYLFSAITDGKQIACLPIEFSLDSKYLRLECGAHSGMVEDGGESFGASVYSLSTGRTILLGQIEQFEWLKTGAFRYKVSKKIACSSRSVCQPDNETCSVCYQATSKLPWKYGVIK